MDERNGLLIMWKQGECLTCVCAGDAGGLAVSVGSNGSLDHGLEEWDGVMSG